MEFQLQHQFFNEYSGLIPFRVDWFDLAVQGTLKSLLQHHSSKASILWHSAFFMVPLSHPYIQGHLSMRPVSRGNSRCSLVCGAAFQKTPISGSALDKNPMPAHHFEGNPVDESTSRRGTDTAVHCLEKTAGSTHSSTSGLSLLEQLERQVEFHSSTQDEA